MKVPISDIIVSKEDANTKRFRKDFGDVRELAESIKGVGLIHPIVVDQIISGVHAARVKYRLIAGERRLRAVAFLGWKEIEVTLKEDVDDLLAKEIELEENVRRKDIIWEENCEALNQLHELKLKQFGQSTRTKEGWNIEKTAEFISSSVGVVSQDIKLAKQLNEHPELRKKVKKLNKASARKLVNQELEAAMLRKVMKDRCINIGYNLENKSCEDGLKFSIPDNSIHCLITDPPFALDKIIAVGGGNSPVAKGLMYNINESNVSTEAQLAVTYNIIIPQLYRKMVEGAHFYIFLGMGWYTRLVHLLRKTGFIVDDQPLIWYKERTSIMARGAHYMSSYEAILFGHRPPQKRILLKPRPNMISIPAINPGSRVHPLQKPFELLKIFIENSTSPGEMVLDCFAGSGSTLMAATKLQRCSRGFEIDSGNYLRALKWLDSETPEEGETVKVIK